MYSIIKEESINNYENIVLRLSKSDKNAFKILFDNYSEAIYNFIFRKINNSDLAEEFTQEVFVKIWLNRNKLDPSQNIKSYIFTAANNRVIDYYRSKKGIPLEELNFYEEAVYSDLSHFDLTDNIKDALDKLTTTQKNVLLLAKFEGLKYREISEILNISVKTVENHMSAAFKTLRETLKHLLTIFIFLIKYLGGKLF